MRYNLHKIMVIWIGGNVAGCVRVVRGRPDESGITNGILALHLDPQYGTNDEVLQMVFKEIDHIKRYVKGRSGVRWMIMSKYMPPLRESMFGFAVSTGQQFGGTARKRSSSVLIDEETGEPLF